MAESAVILLHNLASRMNMVECIVNLPHILIKEG